jgi:peptidoglycan L-alanyl-D-glutamate endopeptidase CwlK
MINSRLISDLTPEAQSWFHRFHAHAYDADLVWGIDWKVCQTLRDQEYQDWLYEQGRSRPGNIVTWTRDSRHLKGEAWDVFFIDEQDEVVWESPKYKKLAEIGRGIGLECGYFWPKKKRDPGHYELPSTVG